jgi:hypothetical protein
MEPTQCGRTRLRLTHSGFGQGDGWDAAHAYFQGAWSRVMARYAERARTKNPPTAQMSACTD